jgi:hypothetical protein
MPVWLRDLLIEKFMRSGVERGRRGAASVYQEKENRP